MSAKGEDEGTRFCDGILIARNVFDHIETNGEFKFPVRLLKDFIPTIAQQSGLPIALERVEWSTRQYKSILLRYTDRALIKYAHSLNTCWRRLVICKEAAHLLLDDSEMHFTTDIQTLIAALITNAPMQEADTLIESERMALMIAIEMLLPWKLRQEIHKVKDTKSDFEIAEYCRIPEKFVNIMFRTPYGEISDRINHELDNPK